MMLILSANSIRTLTFGGGAAGVKRFYIELLVQALAKIRCTTTREKNARGRVSKRGGINGLVKARENNYTQK